MTVQDAGTLKDTHMGVKATHFAASINYVSTIWVGYSSFPRNMYGF